MITLFILMLVGCPEKTDQQTDTAATEDTAE
jgi:hypothetical protein